VFEGSHQNVIVGVTNETRAQFVTVTRSSASHVNLSPYGVTYKLRSWLQVEVDPPRLLVRVVVYDDLVA
jgi:hypothetical protein